jgi:hypothetical protein
MCTALASERWGGFGAPLRVTAYAVTVTAESRTARRMNHPAKLVADERLIMPISCFLLA